jgi:hypothetical protein
MKTKYTIIVMTASAILLGIAGILLTFLPEEILHQFDLVASKPLRFLVEILGALYFGFAMLNWMTRTSIIGGIYNKPIAVANFSHFFIAGIALLKSVMADPGLSAVIWMMAVVYSIFAVCFGIIFYKNPVAKKQPA